MNREQNQRTEIRVIANELLQIVEAPVMDWKRLRYLRTWLGETLRTDAEIAKRQRYLARKKARKVISSERGRNPRDIAILGGDPSL